MTHTSTGILKRKERCEKCRHFHRLKPGVKYAGTDNPDGECKSPIREYVFRPRHFNDWCMDFTPSKETHRDERHS